MERDPREDSIRAVRRAIDAGMVHVDTAEIYGDGQVEEMLGEALAGHRGDVFLASKVSPDHATFTGTLLACEKSLRRLRTDHLDLYLLHWVGNLPLEETFRAFETLVKDGKIRAWGVSNFDVLDLERALEIVGAGVIACNQVLYNLEERDAEHLLQVFCERHGIAFVGYSPLGAGQFPRPGSFKGDVLTSVARAHGVAPHAVALAFLTRRASCFAIPKSAREDHVTALAAAGDLTLTDDELRAIDAAFPLEAPKSKMPFA
jgi:diketogulonate reductase-like aldo/keto reductase